MIARRDTFTLAGAAVALAGRRPVATPTRRQVLVAILDRTNRPTGAYRECHAHELVGPPGVHMAEIKRRIGELDLVLFPFDAPPTADVQPDRGPRPRDPRGRLHAHFAAPQD